MFLGVHCLASPTSFLHGYHIRDVCLECTCTSLQFQSGSACHAADMKRMSTCLGLGVSRLSSGRWEGSGGQGSAGQSSLGEMGCGGGSE